MPLTDAEWAEVASELPSRDDDILKTYLAKRAALKAEEQKERSGLFFLHFQRKLKKKNKHQLTLVKITPSAPPCPP